MDHCIQKEMVSGIPYNLHMCQLLIITLKWSAVLLCLIFSHVRPVKQHNSTRSSSSIAPVAKENKLWLRASYHKSRYHYINNTMISPWCIQCMHSHIPKGIRWAEVTFNYVKIKPVPLAVVKLCWFKGIKQLHN